MIANFVDETPFVGSGGADEVAGKGHLSSAIDANELWQTDRHAAARHDANPGVRVSKSGVLA